MATWIKFNNLGTAEYLNLENTYRIVPDAANLQLTFYDVNSILPLTITFASLADFTETLSKLESIVKVIEIDALAPQR